MFHAKDYLILKIKNTPVVVLSNNDGCVISRSTEAKKLGIKMGEPYFKVKNLVKKTMFKYFLQIMLYTGTFLEE